jgi:amino acid transporter
VLELTEFLFGKPKDPLDPKVFHQISLVAFLAWVGLGADGLSSSAYGPEEAYLALGQHFYLALPLALLTAITVFVISASYSQIIELFPTGGGGYLVATKLLGSRAGLVSGSALVVDYMLTITISVASGADALFSLPVSYQPYNLLPKFIDFHADHAQPARRARVGAVSAADLPHVHRHAHSRHSARPAAPSRQHA